MPQWVARLIGVLVSGSGSNLQALIDQRLPVSAVASNVPDAYALTRAAKAGIPTAIFALEEFPSRIDRDTAMADWLETHGVGLAICAGYMHLLTPEFLARFPTINVHPSLLPDFPGMHAIEDALKAGVGETGTTVHFVDEGVDTGPVIFQEAVPIEEGDSVDTLHERVQQVEHRLLPAAARLYLAGGLPSLTQEAR